jgi:hypothetical protein
LPPEVKLRFDKDFMNLFDNGRDLIMKSSRWLLSTALAGTIIVPGFLGAQPQFHSDLPLRQSSLDYDAGAQALPLKEASRNNRCLGLGVRSVIWAPDGYGVYFRWELNVSSVYLPWLDSWFFLDRSAFLD